MDTSTSHTLTSINPVDLLLERDSARIPASLLTPQMWAELVLGTVEAFRPYRSNLNGASQLNIILNNHKDCKFPPGGWPEVGYYGGVVASEFVYDLGKIHYERILDIGDQQTWAEHHIYLTRSGSLLRSRVVKDDQHPRDSREKPIVDKVEVWVLDQESLAKFIIWLDSQWNAKAGVKLLSLLTAPLEKTIQETERHQANRRDFLANLNRTIRQIDIAN